jgi:hypothetical protein
MLEDTVFRDRHRRRNGSPPEAEDQPESPEGGDTNS